MAKDTNMKEYSRMRREFYNSYKTKIVPVVQQYENKRKIRLIFAIISAALCCIIGGWLLYLGHVNGGILDKSNEGLIKTGIFMFCLAFIVWALIKKSFEHSIKEKIMPTVCQCFGNMSWSHSEYYEGKTFSTSGVIPNYSSDSYDDIFEGSYKDVNIEIVESDFTIGSGKNRRTVFDGVIVKLKMNKKFVSHTVIKPDSLFHASVLPNLKRTELEDPEFNKKFDVFTNDPIDARYLITPTFMERLKNLKTAFKANKVSCAFFNDYLIIALSTQKDLFSLCSLVKKIDDKQQYLEMYEEIVSIIKLIDHFKLNEKIGL